MASEEDKQELLLSCRFGELDEVRQFVDKFGSHALADVRDDNGNSILHMTCGNGHEDVLDYLLPLVPPSLLSAANQAGSTAAHWAALNAHLPILEKLVLFPGGPGPALIDQKNAAGRSPLAEAELSGWHEGAQWLVSQMNLDDVPEEDIVAGDVEVEIQDADGGVARMSLGGK